MQIAITDIKDYNEGILRFEWLDLEEYPTAEAISEFIENFLEKRTKETGTLHEEWFVTDYDEFINLGEYPDLKTIEEAVTFSKKYGWEVAARYYENCRELDNLEEAYNGIWDSAEDFAYELAHDIYSNEQLGELETYIDWERFARDLFIGDYFSEELKDGKIAVFRML